MQKRWLVLVALAVFGIGGIIRQLSLPVYGAQLGSREMRLTNNEVSAVSDYLLSIVLTTPGTLGSITVQFCSNDPLQGTVCTAPNGFDDSAAVLSTQTGPGDFAINSSLTTANTLVLSRTAGAVGAIPLSFHFTGITNTSDAGPSYARVTTYASDDATGASSDYGGIAYSINNSLAISALVPPFLTFCTGITITGLNCANAAGDYLDLGELSSKQANKGTSQMLVATNAVDGYFVSVQGTTMTSGNNVIAALAANDVSRPGAAQFGMNLRANATPAVGNDPSGPGVAVPVATYNQPNSYRFVNGDTLVANSVPDDVRLYTASYIVNIAATQAAGVYVSTLTYICLASF